MFTNPEEFDFEPLERKPFYRPFWHQWNYYTDHLQFEITLLRWGIGFDFGKSYEFGGSLWLGPFYICVGF